jgi:RNA polymerase sigma-70 factor (ECF subfamily)
VNGSGDDIADRELLGRLGRDRAAFEQFYRRHYETVTRFLARRCATPEDVADATSATFISVMVCASTYDPDRGQPVSWLRAIAANEAKRLQKGMSRNDALAKRVRGGHSLTSDEAERIAEMIDAEQEAGNLQLRIIDAPRGEQDLLWAMVDNDVSVTEASRAIGISSGAGYVRLSRLRRRLRPLVQGEDIVVLDGRAVGQSRGRPL